MADQNILLQSFVGRGDAIDGDVFKWVFPIGPTYWGQMANNVQFIKNKSNGNLKGVKVGFIYPDYAFVRNLSPFSKRWRPRKALIYNSSPTLCPDAIRPRCGHRSAATTRIG
jgi:hypothetical protein